MSSINTTCPYCGVGCGVTARVKNDQLIAVNGDRSHPANAGRLCVKGTTLAATLVREGRLLYPTHRGQRLDWDAALDMVSGRLRRVREQYGPDAIAFYLSGQLLTEDYYVANKLGKGFLGTANVDTNSRLCMSSAVAAYKRAFGADLVPCSYLDLESCQLLVMVGSNAAWTHPVTYQRIVESKKRNPAKRIVVIDPRRTATCDSADLHLQILPGSDAFLFAGLLNHLEAKGLVNRDYVNASTRGLEAALEAVGDMDPASVAANTGLSESELAQFYQWFGDTEQTVTCYSQGVNQSATGTDKCNAIINCHLATGRLGREGMGPFSITGQPNAMGGREVGGLANQLASHMDFTPDNVERTGRFWQARDMATGPGLQAVDMFRAAAAGKIRFLWIMATNPAVSLPDTALVRRALERCEFVVLSDCSAATDTADYADLLLPAAGWGEKDGTVTNSERCISRQRQLVTPAGEARPDWWIISEVARRLGYGEHFGYQGADEIFAEHARLSAFENDGGRDFDIGALAGLSRGQYDDLSPTVWPAPAAGPPARPFANGRFYTPDGRARFVPVVPALPQSHRDAATNAPLAPLLLNTGRLRDQWHTMTRTGVVPRLMRHRDYFAISLNPVDARAASLAEHGLVEVSNTQGSIRGLVLLDEDIPAGQVFSPIHWSGQFSGQACVSGLIPAITDPLSGQPQSKYARVSLHPLPAASWGALFSREKPALPALLYWSVIAVAGGYLTLLASELQGQALRDSLLASLAAPGLRTLEYLDTAAGDFRNLGTRDKQLQYALFLNTRRAALPARDWLATLGAELEPTASFSELLAGVDPATADGGRLVCTCWEVGENQINAAIKAGADCLETLGASLRCGTQCGSCIPELKRCLQLHRKEAAA
jgi:assimilatory nitrate reductase catalytic subunit